MIIVEKLAAERRTFQLFFNENTKIRSQKRVPTESTAKWLARMKACKFTLADGESGRIRGIPSEWSARMDENCCETR